MIEVDDVVVRLQRELHQIADRVGVLRNSDPERVLDRAHRGQRVRAGADAADAFGERPGVARIAVLQNDFDAAPHRAGGDGVADDVVLVDVHLDPQMAFDAGDGVDDDPLAGIVEREAVWRLNGHGRVPCPLILQALVSASARLLTTRLTAVAPACAATATPTIPAAVMPTASAFFSTPN